MTTLQSIIEVTLWEEYYRKGFFLYLLSQSIKEALCTTHYKILGLHLPEFSARLFLRHPPRPGLHLGLLPRGTSLTGLSLPTMTARSVHRVRGTGCPPPRCPCCPGPFTTWHTLISDHFLIHILLLCKQSTPALAPRF